MNTKKDAKSFQASAETLSAAKELRSAVGKLNDGQRDALFNRGMELIYGAKNGAKVISHRR